MAKINVEEAKARLRMSSEKPLDVKKTNKKVAPLMAEPMGNEDEIELVDVVNDNIFIFKNDGKYVLSPADDTLEPVIGEFDEVSSDNEIPPCMKEWLDTYSREINYFQENEEELREEYSDEAFDDNGITLVDLGLSVKWANMNLGAEKPEDFGNYYAWGETEPKKKYTTATYKYYDSKTSSYIEIGKDISKNETYDAAYKADNAMCLPTEEQFKELIEKCKWSKKNVNNVPGWEVVGPNGNSIFFPINGCYSESDKLNNISYGYYWSSTDYTSKFQAKSLRISTKPETYINYKRTGVSIRPVSVKENNNIEMVDLGLSVNWANMNLGAEKPEDFGNYYAWGETEPKKKYTISTYKYYDSKTSSYKEIGKDISKNETYDAAYKDDKAMCLPTEEQFKELIEKCKWSKKNVNNVPGWEVVGSNGNSIFFPINGCYSESDKVSNTSYGYYWSSTDYTSKFQAKSLRISTKPETYLTYKRTGIAIRPVSVKQNNVKKSISPIIPYKWSQSAPYSNLLPTDPTTKKRVVTGCTNTALAMIIAYYGCIGINGKKYRRGCTKVDSYVSKKGKTCELTLPALPSLTSFDYKNLNFNNTTDFKTDESKKAVAQLMQYLGYANRSNYSSNGTGASVTNAMITARDKIHLGKNPKIIYASSGLPEFKEQIYNELKQGYPVFFGGWNSSGSSGHIFVCDGYDASTGKFHFNWGWGGSYNGWFDVSLLKPTSSTDYNYGKRCIIGLHPEYIFGDINNDGTINITDVMNIVQAIIDKKTDYKYDINSDGKVNEEDASLLVDVILGKAKI